jgi:hypothetical protein
LEEAAIAGDGFYYSWKQGGENIEGLTVGAALAMIRNFGNCAVEVRVVEQPTSYVFEGVFVDLETGFNLVRPFRQNKQSPKKKDGKDVYTGDRGIDIIFQIGTSKAMRNVALNACPKWLTEKVMDKAKENVTAKIEKMGKVAATEMLRKKAAALQLDWARIEANYGKSTSWETDHLVKISSAMRAVEDGVERFDELFPATVAQGEAAATEEKALDAAKVDTSKLHQPKEQTGAEIGLEEVSNIEGIIKLMKSASDAIDVEAIVAGKLGEGFITEDQAKHLHEEITAKVATLRAKK